MSEQDLVNAIIEYITWRGDVAIRINSGLTFIDDERSGKRRAFRGAPAGTADILACVRGRFVAIECKVGTNKPTQRQQEFLDQIKSAGGIAFVAYSIDDVERELYANEGTS